jgi:hypothetical protein
MPVIIGFGIDGSNAINPRQWLTVQRSDAQGFDLFGAFFVTHRCKIKWHTGAQMGGERCRFGCQYAAGLNSRRT